MVENILIAVIKNRYDKRYVYFGLPAEQIQATINPVSINRTPQSLDFLEGFIDYEGNHIPVIDLKKKFMLNTESHYNKNARIIICSHADRKLAIIVEELSEMIEIPENSIEISPCINAMGIGYIRGMTKLDDKVLIILSIEGLLKESDLASLQSPLICC